GSRPARRRPAACSSSGASSATCACTGRGRRSAAQKRRHATMTQETYVFLNDAWVAPEQARVPVEDRGFQFGDGIYEVVRICRGRPFAMWPHLERLERSARELELPLPRPLPELARLIEEAPARRGLQEATVYLQLTRGYRSEEHTSELQSRENLVCRPLLEKKQRRQPPSC